MALPVLGAHAEYKVGSGDTLALSVYRVQDLNRRAVVDIDGCVSFPPLGRVSVAGLSIDEVQQKLRTLLAGKDVVRDPEVSVELAEARPLYINGDISKPGEYPYRPGMTVRQLVAVAGGYDLVQFRLSAPQNEVADLRGEQRALLADLAKQMARLSRLKAEINRAPKVEFGELGEIPLPQPIVAEITRLEEQQMRFNQDNQTGEKLYLQRLISQTQDQLAALEEQKRQDEDGLRQLTDDLAKARSLYDRGLAPLSRVLDEQRALLLAKTRVSESTANIAVAKRSREEVARNLERIDAQAQVSLLTEIQDASLQLQKLQARLDAVDEKLLQTGTLKSQLLDRAGGIADIAVYRRAGSKPTRLNYDQDTEILPGDIVEVALQIKHR
jgi:polysaccharide export outer membrane protein